MIDTIFGRDNHNSISRNYDREEAGTTWCKNWLRNKFATLALKLILRTFRVYTTTYIFIHHILRNLSLILMLTGVDVLTSIILHLAIVCFLVTILSPRNLRDNSVQRLNTKVLLMWFLNLVGSTTYYWSFTSHSRKPLWCTVIMLVPSIFLVIQYNISANTLRWTFTLFGKRSLVDKHTSSFSSPDCWHIHQRPPSCSF
jgi:hypothetical protein